ncbi:Telomerase reverse transcriptase [Platanthera guangdongensis]|uniref:Telomerase reverse transcriptase n=1 Tax=Platanthera guangdongensis TaxID=2320717 RepID=A0ABR2LST4_9ASPA
MCFLQHDLIDSYSTHQQVVSFVWAATRSLIPEDLLGDYMTWRALRKNISNFVKLRRFERFSLKQCMHQLKVSHYPLLSKTTFLNCTCNGFNGSLQNKLFRNWIYWYFSHVVVPLLGNNFYVTERETGKQDIFYYPRPIWKKLFRSTVSHLKDLNYSILDRASLEKILCERVKVQSKFIWYKSVNNVLHELYVVLKSIKAEDPNKLGASVFDYNEVYQRLYQFITRVRNGSEDFHKLFIVVADVAKAYDSIDQDMLIGIMNDVIPRDTYFFRNYSRFVCTKNSIKVMPYRLGSFHCSKNHDIMKIEASIQLNSSRHVFIDKGTGVEVSNHMLHRVLSEHLKHNILQIGPDYYLQEVGITQGSVLSSLLCSFYYGYLERNVIFPFLEKAYEISSRADKRELEFLDADDHENKLPKNASSSFNSTEVRVSHKPITNSNKPQNLLLRFVDDFLFISTSEQQASSFFTRMRRGFKAFNSYMNFKKFGFNFNIEGNPVAERFYTGADGKKFIPWCGLLINSENLEIQADYTRYWGSHVSSTITIQPNTGSGCTLQKKLCDYVRPKCYPLFYDSNINSLPTVTLNAYQAFLLCAMKFHCYARSMPSFNELNPSYILDIFLFSFRYMYKLLKKRMHQVEIRQNVKPILKLRKTEMLWLGLCAYARVLKKKQSRYKELISMVRSKIAELDVDYSIPYLRYAVDDSHSSLFWEIAF